MQMNLRRASALISEIRLTAKNIKVDTKKSFNFFDDNIVGAMKTARQEAIANFDRRVTLENAAFVLRALIGRANVTSGISDLLSEDSFLEAKESLVNSLVHAETAQSSATVQREVDARRKTSENSERSIYGRFTDIELNLLETGDINCYKELIRDIRKTRRNIKDRTVDLNVRTEIEVPSDVEETLRKEGLI